MGGEVVTIYWSSRCPRPVLLVRLFNKPFLVNLDLLVFFLGLEALLALGSHFAYTSLSWNTHFPQIKVCEYFVYSSKQYFPRCPLHYFLFSLRKYLSVFIWYSSQYDTAHYLPGFIEQKKMWYLNWAVSVSSHSFHNLQYIGLLIDIWNSFFTSHHKTTICSHVV